MLDHTPTPATGRARVSLARKWTLLLILVLLLQQVFVMVWGGRHNQSIGLDFYQFWLGGRAATLMHGTSIYSSQGRAEVKGIAASLLLAQPGPASKLYRASARREVPELFSTPLLYSFFDAISTGDYERDLTHDHVMILACTSAAIITLALLAGHPLAMGMLLLVLTLLLSRASAADFIVGNVNSIQLALLALFLLLQRSSKSRARIAAGAVLALAILFKPNLIFVALLVVLWRLVRRQWRSLALLILGGGVGILLSVLFSIRLFSPVDWLRWAVNLPSMFSVSTITLAVGNASLTQMIQDHGGPDLSLAFLAILLAAVFVAIWSSRRRSSAAATPAADQEASLDFLAVGLGCVIPILCMRLVWMHYYDLCLPLLIWALRFVDGPHSTSTSQAIRTVVVISALILVFHTPIETLHYPSSVTVAIDMYVGALLLFVLGCWGLGTDVGVPAV